MCVGGVPPGCFLSDYLSSRTGGCQYPNKTVAGRFIFTIAASFFFSMHLTANCRNLPELGFACYVVVEKKIGPVSEGESLWMHLPFDDYNVGHGE